MSHFDVFGDGCYFDGNPITVTRAGVGICADCAIHYTAEEIAAKRLIAALLLNKKGEGE